MADITRGIRPEINRAMAETVMLQRDAVSSRWSIGRLTDAQAAEVRAYLDDMTRAISAVAAEWDTKSHEEN